VEQGRVLRVGSVVIDFNHIATKSRLWQEAQQAGATIIAAGERSVAIGRDETSSTIITGDQNVIKP
jgi:hypothetical protein